MNIANRSPIVVKDEGRAARYRGDPATANPYPEASDEHAIWKRAWEQPDEIVGEDTCGVDPNKQRMRPGAEEP